MTENQKNISFGLNKETDWNLTIWIHVYQENITDKQTRKLATLTD